VVALSGCGQCGGRISEPARCLNGHVVTDEHPVRLDKLAELVADRLAPVLAEQLRLKPTRSTSPIRHRLVDVHEIARITGMSERWTYDHAAELGGVKTGSTKRARWRFDPDKVLARLAARDKQAVGEHAARRPPAPELPTGAELLPVKGRAA
jgi:hypothetical protein